MDSLEFLFLIFRRALFSPGFLCNVIEATREGMNFYIARSRLLLEAGREFLTFSLVCGCDFLTFLLHVS